MSQYVVGKRTVYEQRNILSTFESQPEQRLIQSCSAKSCAALRGQQHSTKEADGRDNPNRWCVPDVYARKRHVPALCRHLSAAKLAQNECRTASHLSFLVSLAATCTDISFAVRFTWEITVSSSAGFGMPVALTAATTFPAASKIGAAAAQTLRNSPPLLTA